MLHYMTAHPTQLQHNTLHIKIQPHPLRTRLHNLPVVILHTLPGLMPLKHHFWQRLPRKPPKFTQARAHHNGEPHQTQ